MLMMTRTTTLLTLIGRMPFLFLMVISIKFISTVILYCLKNVRIKYISTNACIRYTFKNIKNKNHETS